MKKMFLLACMMPLLCSAKNYYVDSANGYDGNTGLSSSAPLRSLLALPADLSQTDSILLKSGETFVGSLNLVNVGSNGQSLVVTTYGGSKPAMLSAKNEWQGLLIKNSSNVTVENLTITANPDKKSKLEKGMRCGILITTEKGGKVEHVTVKDCEVRDVFYELPGFHRGATEVTTANGTQSYGWGIRGIVGKDGGRIKDILIKDVNISRVSHTGIKFTGMLDEKARIANLRIIGCNIEETGGPGMQFSCVDDAYIGYNKVLNSGSEADSRNWGRGSGMWTWSVDRFLIEHNSFVGANGPGDSAGAHIDYNCKNVVLQYNFSANNAGGFVEILGNCHNCSYRYNVSVNDGYRVKNIDGAFQEGKTLWLSGFVGDKKRNGPYNSYIYNNTIYVSKAIDAKMAIENTASGALIANNIFYIEGETTVVPGDQYTPEKAGESEVKNVFIKNNLYLHSKGLPKEYMDQSPIYSKVEFANLGGNMPSDYVPFSRDQISRGVSVQKLPGDEVGLFVGLDVKEDFFGNPITKPILGAIIPNNKVAKK